MLTQNSDIRLKKNIAPLKHSIDKLLKIQGYHYYWKHENSDQALQTGFIAQEIQKEFPELVKEDKKGALSVNYSGMIPYLLEAIKEQQQRIDKLEKRLSQLEK